MYCKECGSTVTASDRFCAACGTPNVLCKFHPKFGPGLKVFEPRILTERAPAGAPSCPRCHRLIERPDEYCGACGMELDAAWERYDRVTVLNAWRKERGMELERYHRNRWLGDGLLALLTVGIVLATAVGTVNLWLYARGEGILRGGPTNATMWNVLDVATTLAGALFVLGGLVTIVWTWRAYRNLPALAVGDLRFRSSWAVLGWVVPGFNLFRPKQIMDDLWRGSHPYAPPFSSSWRVGPVPVWSALWWAAAWVGGVLALASHLLTPPPGLAHQVDLQSSLALTGFSGLLLAGAALCQQLLVRRIRESQELRAEIVLATEVDDAVVPHAGRSTGEPTRLLKQPADMDAVSGKY